MDFVSQKKSKKKRDSSLKVVYISSPVKVKTSASKFRTTVQKLTGQDSDISSYMEGNSSNGVTTTTGFEILPESSGVSSKSLNDNNQQLLSSKSPRESPTSSDSLLEQSFPSGDVFMNSQIEEQYWQGVFPSNLFCDSSQLAVDVLGSYDAL